MDDQTTLDQSVQTNTDVEALKNQRVHQQDIVPGAIKPKHLIPSKTQAKGDTYYSDGTNFVRTAIGATGQYMGVTGGAPGWVAAPATPKQTTLYDSNGNVVIETHGATGPANDILASNAATGSAPSFTATGPDTNIDISLKGKGTGTSLLTVRRQGGSSTDWTVTGTTNYTESGVLIQTGVFDIPSQTTYTITFPTAFSQPPLCFGIEQGTGGVYLVVRTEATTTQVVFYPIITGSLDVGTTGHWLAIGKR